MRADFKVKYLMGLLAAFVGALVLTISAFAYAAGSITFTYITDNVRFSLYRIGDINADGSFNLSGSFAKYDVSLSDKAAAQTLEGYVDRDSIPALMTAKTDSESKAVFGGLDKGIYLILGETVTKNNVKYTALPVIASVTQGSSISINGKHEAESIPSYSGGGGGGGSGNRYTSITVIKVWKGNKARTEITAQLLKDDQVYDEVVLNEKNNWRYTWSKISKTNEWSVVEKEVPSGYVVGVEKDGATYIITNTPKEDVPTPDTPDGPTIKESTEATSSTEITTASESIITTENTEEKTTEEPVDNPVEPENPNNTSGDGSNGSDNPTDDNTSDNTENIENPDEDDPLSDALGSGDKYYDSRCPNGGNGTNDEISSGGGGVNGTGSKLPQTGLLWWPVVLLSCFGTLFLIIGMGRKREGR